MTIKLYELTGKDAARPFSPHCWKTVMSLAHKGLDFEQVATPFTAVPKVEGGLGKTVPVIVDGDRKVIDSFAIAEYLEDTYPDRPSLFGGPGGRAAARFVEQWSFMTIHPLIGGAILMDIHAMLESEDQDYFRSSRETRFGKPLEALGEGRDDRLKDFLPKLQPLRATLERQPWLGGEGPLFTDYIVFGAFQWARICSPWCILPDDDPVAGWFGRCLDLHGGIGRAVPAAA